MGFWLCQASFPMPAFLVCGLLIGQTSINLAFKGHAFPVGVILACGGALGLRAAPCLSASRCLHQA